jgi:BirA family transcriptional regulator, biotin operon repressor / biotin---[acetyl-CoA-carboxylase] ligase
MASDLSDEILERALVGRFGRYRRVYDSIDSTNLEALRWAAEQGAAEGSLVVADSQTAGRGRWGRSWLSQPGAGLLFSVVLRPSSLEPGLLTTAGGLAVARAIEEGCALPTLIKWPNDVLIGERKVSGILVESRSVGHAANAAVLGAGINLHGRPDDWPAELAAGATSIALEVESTGSGRIPARAELLGSVLRHLQSLYDGMNTQEGRAEIIEQAGARSAILGRAVTIRFADGSSAEGVASALAPDGGLLLEDGPAIAAGEIERLRPR